MRGERLISTEVNHESGFGLVELMLGGSVLAVALMGSASALTSGLRVAINTKTENRANDEAQTVIEDFRASCSSDFAAALQTYAGRKLKKGKYTVTTEIILDETRFSPRLDLNGDGDTDDTNLSPADVNAVYIAATVDWGNGRSMRMVDLLARSEISRSLGGKTTTGGTTTGGTGGTTGGTGGTTGGTGGTTTGGGTTGGATTGGDTTVGAVSSSVSGSKIVMTLGVENGPVTVIGVKVEGQSGSFIKEVKVAGAKVFSDKTNALPEGALIPVSPFQMESGETKIDHIKFQATSSGGKTSIAGESFTVTLYHDSGMTTVVNVK